MRAVLLHHAAECGSSVSLADDMELASTVHFTKRTLGLTHMMTWLPTGVTAARRIRGGGELMMAEVSMFRRKCACGLRAILATWQ